MASTTYYADIQKLYVAYFNRPADVAGLNFWEGVVERANGDTSAVSAAFSASAEYQAAYGGKNAYQVVATVYQNLFGHAPDQAGLDFWAQNLMKGAFTVSEAVTAIAAGAQGSDLTAYNNKVTAAGAFTSALNDIDEILGYDGAEANLRAKAFMAGVTTDASLAAAIEPAALDAAIDVVITPPAPPVASFTLAATAASVDEGKTIYFNLGSTNAVAGSEYSYKITGVDAGDVVGGALTGTVKLDSAGKAIVAITLSADAKTEGVESLSLEVAGQVSTVTVADVSIAPPSVVSYALSSSIGAVDEGGQVTFRLDTTGVAPGTVLSYQITGVDPARINGATAGQVVVDANGQALVVVKTVANQTTDGASTLQLSLVNGQASSSVVLNDTSVTNTVFTVDSAKIVASNNTGSPVVVTTGDTGTATVNVASTTALHATNGIVIQGDADVTVNMGANNTAGTSETVYVTGSGNNTVNFGRQSTDSVVMGSGDDTVIVNSLTMAANQSIDFGTGEDTLDVHGTNDFSAGTLSGIENVTMHSSAVFSAAQLAAIETVTEMGAGGTLTIASNDGASVDLTGKLVGEMALVIAAGVDVTLSAAELANLTSVTTNGNASIVTSVAGAQALLAINADANYSISDTAENLAAAPAEVFEGSGLVGVEQDGTGTLSIAQAVAIHATAPSAEFTVSATADELMKALVFETTYETLVSAQSTVVVTGTVDVVQALVFAQADLETTYTITDSAQHVADYADDLNADQIAGLSLSGTVTAGGAAVLVTLAADADVAIAGLNVVDEAGALLNLAPTTIAAATSIRLEADEVLSVADATELKAEVGAKLVGGYDLEDSAATIVSKPAIAAGANDIVITDASVGVAVATQLTKLGNNGTVSFDLVDSPANLAGASAAVLASAASVEVQGDVTVAQATAIASYNVDSFVLVDTAANILGASEVVIEKALAAGHVEITDATISAATAAALFEIDAGADFTVTDSAAALLTLAEDDVDVLYQAGAVTVTGTATVAQISELTFDHSVMVNTYDLRDTAAAILAGAPAVIADAGEISVTGAVTVAQLLALVDLPAFDGVYTIVDTAAAVASLTGTDAGLDLLDGSTAPVVLTETDVDVATATALKVAGFTNWNGIYNLVDDVTALIGATAAVRNGAGTVTAEDTIANINAQFAFINANADGYVLVDTITNMLSGNAIVVAGADAGLVVDGFGAPAAITAAQAASLFSLNADVDYNVVDTAANLLTAANKTAVQNAAEVDIIGNVSVVDAGKIAALHANVNYTLSDTAANLAATLAAGTVAGADDVIVTGAAATAAQAAAIVSHLNEDASLTLPTIRDTVAAIQGASAETIVSADALIVTDGNRLVLSVAEVAHFGQIGGVLSGVTTVAAGASSPDVHYNLVDTFDNLASDVTLLAGAGDVTVLAGGDVVAVAAAAAALATLDAAGIEVTGFSITGDAIDLLANGAVVSAAAGVQVADEISAATAKLILALNGAADYTITDGVAGLTLGANAGAVSAAADVNVTGTANVDQIKSILVLNGDADFSAVAFNDTAAKLAGAPAGMLAEHAVTVTGNATVAQYLAIEDAVTTVVSINVVDSAAAVAAAGADALADANSVAVNTAATAAQAAVLAEIGVVFNVSDNAANLIAITDGLDAAGTITVTGIVSAAQATEMAAIEADMSTSIDFGNITVTDTAAHLMDLDVKAGIQFASHIVVTGEIDVATAAYLSEMTGSTIEYTIVDTMANLIASIEQTSGGLEDFNLNAILGNADAVTITGDGSIELVDVADVFYVTGTIADLKALPEAFLDFGYVVNDSVANIVADFGFAVAGETQYSITDTGANLLTAATTLLAGAGDVTVTGTVSAATATTIFTANGNATFSIVDTVANLVAAGNLLAVSNADAVSATNAATAAQAATLLARNGHAVYTVSDNATAILANVAAVDAATSAAVSGAGTTVAQIAAIKAFVPVTSYSLTDNATNLVAATGTTVNGATAVVVTGTATGDQAKAIFAAKATAVYSIDESVASKLFTGDALNAAVIAAVAVDGDLTVNVAQAQALATLGAKFDGTFEVVDNAAAVAAASQTLLDDATDVTVTGTATAAQAAAIAALTFSGAETHIDVSIVDNATNLLLAANADGIENQDVTVTGSISVATAEAIDAANGTGTLFVTALSDTSTNLQMALNAVLANTDAIHVTDSQTVAQAIFMEANVGAGAEYSFARITDSLDNILAHQDIAGDASVITVTGTVTVEDAIEVAANADLSAKLSAALAIDDFADNILDAYLDQSFKALVSSAPSISVMGDVTAAQATMLQGFGNVVVGSLDIRDSITAIKTLSTGLINLSDSVTALVDTDLGRSIFSDAGMSTNATIVYSNGGGAPIDAVTVTAPGVYNTTAADVLTLKAGDLIDLSAFGLTIGNNDGTLDNGEYMIVRGNVSNGSNTFTYNATGTSTLVVFDDDTGAGVHMSGVILVGQAGTQLTIGGVDAADLSLVFTPPGGN